MAQPVLPGSYTALFSQRLTETILQLAATNPLAIANTGVTGAVTAQIDGMLLQNISSMDGMLSTVGLQVGSGLNPGGIGNAGGLGGGLPIGGGLPVGLGPQLGGIQPGIQPANGLALDGTLSLTG